MMNTVEEEQLELPQQRQANTYEQFRPDQRHRRNIEELIPAAGINKHKGASHFLRARDSIEKARRDMQRRRQAAAQGGSEFLSRTGPAYTDRTYDRDRDYRGNAHHGSYTPGFVRGGGGGGHADELYVKMADLAPEIQTQLLMSPDASHGDPTSAGGGRPYQCHVIREPARLSAQPTPEEIQMSFAQADLAVLMETDLGPPRGASAATSPPARPQFADLLTHPPSRCPPRGPAPTRPAPRTVDVEPADAAASKSSRGAGPAPSPLHQLLQRLATSPLNRTHAVLKEPDTLDSTSEYDATSAEEEAADSADVGMLENVCRNLVTLSMGLGEGSSCDTTATEQARHRTDHASSSRQARLMNSLAMARGVVRHSTDHASSSRHDRLMNRLDQLQALASSGSAPASISSSSRCRGHGEHYPADVSPSLVEGRNNAADISPSFVHGHNDIGDDDRNDDINNRDISTSDQRQLPFKRTYEVPVWTHSNRSKRNRNASAASSSTSSRSSLNPNYDLVDHRRDQSMLPLPSQLQQHYHHHQNLSYYDSQTDDQYSSSDSINIEPCYMPSL